MTTIIIALLAAIIGGLAAQTDFFVLLLEKVGLKDFQRYPIPEIDTTRLEAYATDLNLELTTLKLESRAHDEKISKGLELLFDKIPDEIIARMDTDKLIAFIEKEGYKVTK